MVFYALEVQVAATRAVNSAAAAVSRSITNGTGGSSSTSNKLAQSGCRERCGNVSIPYPFGMDDPNCYSPGFEINCNDSVSPPVASFISSNGDSSGIRKYVVLDLTLDYVRINVSVPAICDQDNTTSTTSRLIDPRSGFSEPILHGTPFTISNTLNTFTVLGCNIFGFVIPLNGINFTSSGCASRCDNRFYTDNPINPCDANDGCCKATVPKGLSDFKIQTTSTGDSVLPHVNQQNRCIRPFVVDHEFQIENLINSKVDSVVPVILDWAVPDFSTCKEARGNPNQYACGWYTDCVDPANGSGYRCKCAKGYKGNPYLQHGCQDVDECKGPNKCGKETICINTAGNYRCDCSPGMILRFRKMGYQCTRDERKLLTALYVTP
ncbi:hypothetical protein MKW94_026564, partial [Papaver nudicaule]|nr:hypothetical protein [Papaver nudicaule]